MASELDYKIKFAEYLAEGIQPLEAAMRTFKPDGFTNASFLLKVTKEWPNDPDVISAKIEIEQNTTSETKFKAKLWRVCEQTSANREGPNYWRLFAEVSGFIKNGNGGKGGGKEGEDKLNQLMEMLGP